MSNFVENFSFTAPDFVAHAEDLLPPTLAMIVLALAGVAGPLVKFAAPPVPLGGLPDFLRLAHAVSIPSAAHLQTVADFSNPAQDWFLPARDQVHLAPAFTGP